MIFPACAKEIPIPTAITRKHPTKIESPIPDKGPINAVLILAIASPSTSPLAFISSIEVTTPPTNGANCGVILKNSTCLTNASRYPSSSPS